MKSAIKANGNGVVGTPVEWVENWVIFVARWRIAFEYSFRICSPKIVVLHLTLLYKGEERRGEERWRARWDMSDFCGGTKLDEDLIGVSVSG